MLSATLFCSCADRDIAVDFTNTYSKDMSFSEYCGQSNLYELHAKIEDSHLRLWLKKNEQGEWSGVLDYKEWSKTIEEIPVKLDGDELVLLTSPETRLPFEPLLMYRAFDPEMCSITWAAFTPFDYPKEELEGDYPLDVITPYMEELYSSLYANLTSFEKEEEYFDSLRGLEKFAYIKSLESWNPDGHTLSFGFNGCENVDTSADFSSYEDISLFVYEHIQFLD